MQNPEIDQTIAHVLQGEEKENQKKIHLVRMYVLILMSTMMIISRLVMGEPVHETFLVITPASLIYLVFVFFMRRRLVQNRDSSSANNILPLLDLAYVVITLFGVSQQAAPYTFHGFLEEPPFLILFLLNALSGLRFDFKASIYVAAASILVIFGM